MNITDSDSTQPTRFFGMSRLMHMCNHCGRFVNTTKPIPFQYGCGLESERPTAQKYTDQFAKLCPPFTSAVADPLPLTTKEIHAMLALGDRGRKPKTVALKMASLQPAAPEEISPLPSNTDVRRQGGVAKIPARRYLAAIARQARRRC